MCANRQDVGDRPLGDDQVNARLTRFLKHDGQALAHEVVGNLVDLPVAVRSQSRGFASRDDGRIERVLDAGLECGIEKGEVSRLARGSALDIDRLIECNEPLGQRAGLVGAEHVDAAEVLDRLEATDQHATARHDTGAGRKRDADNCRQKLRRQADRERDSEQHGFDDRSVEHLIDRQHEDDQEHHDPDQEIAKLADAARELGLGWARLQARSNRAEGRALSRRHDQHGGGAAPH